jgi:putative Holliday junction resolvase
MPEQKPRILGLDIGAKTIGVAVSDVFGWTAQPVGLIRRGQGREMRELADLVARYGVTEFLLGYPRNMNGTVGSSARAVERFAELLRQEFLLPVRFWDERLTTVAAERALLEADMSRVKRRQVIDQTAAALILQGYLDRLSRPTKNAEPARKNLTLRFKQSMMVREKCRGGINMADDIKPELDEEELVDCVLLTDDEGVEHEFVHLDTLEVDGGTYFVLLPVDEDEEDEDDEDIEAIILKLERNEDGEEILVDIDDDEEWDKVSDAWDAKEEEAFEDEE